MKSLQEIKQEYADNYGYVDFMDMLRGSGDWSHDKYIDDIAKQFANEVAKQALINASIPKDEYGNNIDLIYENHDYHIPQSLVTSESNIPNI